MSVTGPPPARGPSSFCPPWQRKVRRHDDAGWPFRLRFSNLNTGMSWCSWQHHPTWLGSRHGHGSVTPGCQWLRVKLVTASSNPTAFKRQRCNVEAWDAVPLTALVWIKLGRTLPFTPSLSHWAGTFSTRAGPGVGPAQATGHRVTVRLNIPLLLWARVGPWPRCPTQRMRPWSEPGAGGFQQPPPPPGQPLPPCTASQSQWQPWPGPGTGTVTASATSLQLVGLFRSCSHY